METINIIFSADDNYAPFLGVALCSIFENKKNNYLTDIYILDGGIKENNKNKLESLAKKYASKINFVKIDPLYFKDFYISGHITQATYYRVLAPSLLSNLKKALYLDCDIIVLGDIFKLYNININDYLFAAVAENVTDRQEELNMPTDAKYFNSGVMLMNLQKWREMDISKKLIDFIKSNPEKLRFWDQDALNAITWKNRLDIGFKYNYTTRISEKHPVDYTDLEKNILIIHYTPLKPWNYLYVSPLKEKYFYYLDKTEWRDVKMIDKNLKNIIIKFLQKMAFIFFPEKIINLIKKIKRFLGIKFY